MVHFNTFPHYYRWFAAFFWATCLSSLVFNVSQAIIWWAWFRCSLQEKSNDSFTEQRLLIESSLLVGCKMIRYYAEFSACQKRCQVISHSLPLNVCNSVNKLPTKWQFYFPTDLVNTKTTIPLGVGEQHVSVYIHHYSPHLPLRG